MMNRNADVTTKTALGPGRDEHGRFAPGNSHRFAHGKSGNRSGRPKGASFSAALSRQALKPVYDREEIAKIARSIGLDPERAQNIDVVASLFYAALSRSLLRAAIVAANCYEIPARIRQGAQVPQPRQPACD